MTDQQRCPFANVSGARTQQGVQSNRDWWPAQLNLQILRLHSEKSNPIAGNGPYADPAFIRLAKDD